MQRPRARNSRPDTPRIHEALIALARLLARQAAREVAAVKEPHPTSARPDRPRKKP